MQQILGLHFSLFYFKQVRLYEWMKTSTEVSHYTVMPPCTNSMCVSSHLLKWFYSRNPDIFYLAQLRIKWPGCLSLCESQHLCVFILAEFGQSDSDSLISCTSSHTIPSDHNKIAQIHTCNRRHQPKNCTVSFIFKMHSETLCRNTRTGQVHSEGHEWGTVMLIQ